MDRLSQLFITLGKKGIKVNISKSKFAQRQVKFLGHVVSQEECKPDPANVKAILAQKPPSTVVRRFLGMCDFYRQHVPQYAEIASPLTNLTKNIPFQWTEKCQEAFDTLKQGLVSAPVLVRADVTKPFIVTTDSSVTHVGGG